ncbi:Dabb family protein [bacterium]|nr:Dabb family protein [bacterium]
MLKHVVLFKKKPEVSKADFDLVISKFSTLHEEISEISSWWFRLPENPGSPYEGGIVSEFESEAALQAYVVHPAHEKLAAEAGTVATAAVFDAWG